MAYSAPKGTKDVLPADSYKWHYLENILRSTAERYGFRESRTPVIEHTELFLRSVGDTTDVVQKEMYTFTDKGNRSITLKPEGTAGTVRMFVESGMFNDAMPMKTYYLNCPVFRYEKPQAGRLREHHQFGVEMFGAPLPSADAEIISLAWDIYSQLGADKLTVKLNSIGCPKCRNNYQEALKQYLSLHEADLCETCRDRLKTNPLRVLDCKVESCKKINENAPHTIDYVCDECKTHLDKVQEYLTATGIPYEIDPLLVRGLDYYTKTVFEIVSGKEGAQGTLCGGGRYDCLVKQIGGPDLAGIGFGMGMERLLLYLDQIGAVIPEPSRYDLLLFGVSDREKTVCYTLSQQLRGLGLKTDIDSVGRSVKANMKYAGKVAARYVLIVGEDELKTNTCNLKSLTDGVITPLALDARAIADFINN